MRLTLNHIDKQVDFIAGKYDIEADPADLFERFLTQDEYWFNQFDPESKRQFRYHISRLTRNQISKRADYIAVKYDIEADLAGFFEHFLPQSDCWVHQFDPESKRKYRCQFR